MRPQLRRLLRLLSFALVFGAASIAFAQGDPRVEARAHYQAGMARFNAAQYAEAIAEFQAAEQIAPAPMNYYNIALAYERLGDAASAVRSYRSYLDRMPNATNRPDVEAAIKKLEPQAAAQAEAAAAAEAARQAAEAAAAEAARQAAEAQQPPAGAAATGDPELDRVAAINVAQMRGAEPLPPASGGGNGGAASPAAPATPAGDKPKSSSRPFYKSPVFWVLAAVGVYVLIVLADDNSSSQSGLTNTRLLLPDNAPASSSAPALFRF